MNRLILSLCAVTVLVTGLGPALLSGTALGQQKSLKEQIVGSWTYVSADTVENAKKVARQIRAGNVNLQGVPNDRTAPFGGYKQSGNGREWGRYGMEEYLEVKAVAGFNAA